MKRLARLFGLLPLLLPGCKDSVSGFLSCGIDVCSAREECVETAVGPACVCAEGFEGAGCSNCASGYERVDSNTCRLIPIDCDDDKAVCGVHGSCTEKASGDECSCDELYAGRLCELCTKGYQDNDSDGICRASCAQADLSCKAPSHCSDARGTAICDCPAGYTGDDCSRCSLGYRDSGTACVATCEASVTSCSDSQVCVDSPTGAHCECAEGYAGAGCGACAQGYREDPSTGSCLPSCEGAAESCGEFGHCDDSAGFAHCVCDLGHVGKECDECLTDFAAMAGGQCVRKLGSAETLVMSATYQGRQVLATIDPSSGATLPLFELGATGLASGMEPQTLLLNQSGAITELRFPAGTKRVAVPGSGAVGPLAWDPAEGRLYGISGKAPFSLLSIDPDSKVVVELFDTHLAGVADLAFDAGENRLLALRDTLFAISLTDGAVTNLGALPPATLGVELGDAGALLALAATDADEATSRVQACRATATRLEIPGYSTATGRFVQPAAAVSTVSLEANAADTREVLSYLGRGGSGPERIVVIDVVNPQAIVCLALEEATRIEVADKSRFRALVVYAADAEVVLANDTPVATEPRIFVGGYAPSFTLIERADVVSFTPQEWLARRLPIDTRFYQPGPGVLHTLDAALGVNSSSTLGGASIPAGSLSSWRPVLP